MNETENLLYISCPSSFIFSNFHKKEELKSNFFLTCDKKYKTLQFSFYSDLPYLKNSNLSFKLNKIKLNAKSESENSRYVFLNSQESLLYLLNEMKKKNDNIFYLFGNHDENYYSIYQYNIKNFNTLLTKLYHTCNIK